MKLLTKLVLIFLLLGIYYYLLLPDPPFPDPIPGSIQSTQGSDIETPLRRGYYTNVSREEAIDHFLSQIDYLPTLRFIYPPEDAQTVIRDQTQSNYLEEFAHPFRSSIYFNSYIAPANTEAILFNGEEFEQKIIIRYATSHPAVRIAIVSLSLLMLKFILQEWVDLARDIWRKKPKFL
jgi:hypothetical protein